MDREETERSEAVAVERRSLFGCESCGDVRATTAAGKYFTGEACRHGCGGTYAFLFDAEAEASEPGPEDGSTAYT